MTNKVQWIVSLAFSFEFTGMFAIWYYFFSTEKIEGTWLIFIFTFILAIPIIRLMFWISEEYNYEED